MELAELSTKARSRMEEYVKLEYESGIRWKDDDPQLLEAWEELNEELTAMGEELTVPEVSELVVQMAAIRNGTSTGNGNSSRIAVKHTGIEYRNADIATVEADVIVNAANAKGYMGGWLSRYVRFRGVAESLNYATRGTIEKEARMRVRGLELGLGDVYITDSYNLPANKIVHAVTMIKPGSRSNIGVVRKCLDSVETMCRELGAQTVAIPLLGAGTGRVCVDDVLALYKDVLGSIPDVKFIIVTRSFVEREKTNV